MLVFSMLVNAYMHTLATSLSIFSKVGLKSILTLAKVPPWFVDTDSIFGTNGAHSGGGGG